MSEWERRRARRRVREEKIKPIPVEMEIECLVMSEASGWVCVGGEGDGVDSGVWGLLGGVLGPAAADDRFGRRCRPSWSATAAGVFEVISML